jgi:hypothetical protein
MELIVNTMTAPSTLQLIAAALFALAVVHTFSTRFFERLAHTQRAHAGLWHLLGEVETVFGFWALLLLAAMTVTDGWEGTIDYLDSRHFTEPMFVFAIMVVAASRPVMQLAADGIQRIARMLPLAPPLALFFASLSVVPLLGSLITEPAAMTLAALMLRDTIFSRNISKKLKYATLGVLFVNVSIGGTLTSFAAPPVLMVAAKWGWSTAHIFGILGWKALIAVLINAALVTLIFRNEVRREGGSDMRSHKPRVPRTYVAINVALLASIVLTNEHREVFMGLFLLFLGLADAYKRYHDPLILREGLMVAFFLAGLVVLGGQQQWWLQPLLVGLDESALFFGATALTAVTDNAALTYLGSQVDGISDAFKVALVAGAVAGGGLTIIANAPNPAGFAILQNSFEDGSINPFGLFAAAFVPTTVAVLCLWGLDLRGPIAEAFDAARWMAWFESLDRSFLFLLILPFVIVAVGFWADMLRKSRERTGDKAAAAARSGGPVKT